MGLDGRERWRVEIKTLFGQESLNSGARLQASADKRAAICRPGPDGALRRLVSDGRHPSVR